MPGDVEHVTTEGSGGRKAFLTAAIAHRRWRGTLA